MRGFYSCNFSILLFSEFTNPWAGLRILYFYQTFILDFYLVLTSALLFFFNLVYLMPKINKLKDERNEKAFKISHFISVVINFAQLVMLGIVLA